jgi:tRNA (mo5U34)-methyltransferase
VSPASALQEQVAALSWYQSIDLGEVTTPGDYDMGSALRHIPFPESLAGKRCLDVGTRDGFWAFEMERRGAAEVVAIDLTSQAEVDFPLPRPSLTPEVLAALETRNDCFELAHRTLQSGVDWRAVNVYDLDPDVVGLFDFAFIGTLLLHLRNPVDALAAIGGVLHPTGVLMSNNPVSLPLTVHQPKRPSADILMEPNRPFFYVPNVQGHLRMVEAAGFAVQSSTRPYLFRYGEGWETRKVRLKRGGLAGQLIQRLGAPHTCVVAHPK